MMDATVTARRACISGNAWRPLKVLHRWWRARRMVLALSALDDATLKDIGVYRCEIPRLAHDQYTGRWMV